MQRFTETRSIGPVGPKYAEGDRVWFYPVASGPVLCEVVGYDVNASQYQCKVTARNHPVYRHGDTLFTSTNWLAPR